MSLPAIEHVSLQSFKRGLKKNRYFGLFCCFSRVLDGSVGMHDEQVNFTHRTAHGELGAGDITVDDADLAKSVLSDLKRDF